MKPASILSHAEGHRLHKLATSLADATAALLNGKPKRRRRRKVKATATPRAKKSVKGTAAKATATKAKKYPVESTTN